MKADDRLNPQLEQLKRCGELIMAAIDEPVSKFHPGVVIDALLALAHSEARSCGMTNDQFADVLDEMAVDVRRGDFTIHAIGDLPS
jgi:hypothetical protein